MRAAILLAAGSSRRFGRGDKLIAILAGRPLLLHALDRARATGVRRVIVVTAPGGGSVARLVRAARDPHIRHVRAARHGDGLSASLAAALKAVRPIERELLIFLADMPFAQAPRALRLPCGHHAARPETGGRPGHPLLVRTHAARAASHAAGDAGPVPPRRGWGGSRGCAAPPATASTSTRRRRSAARASGSPARALATR